MSSNAAPISPARFALAIQDLPLESLHAKGAELRNSLAHLASSNAQLRPLADEGDAVCAEAVRENEAVMARMRERLGLLKAEVEGRGLRWVENEEGDAHEVVNGEAGGVEDARVDGGERGGRLSDEELARRLMERMDEDGDDGEGGMHL